jgi:hypothetical protein
LLRSLGLEGGDFGGCNSSRPWPACARHDQTAHA